MPPTPLTHADYTVAWISALPLEMAAATSMLDEIHPVLSQSSLDPNNYTLGKVNGHNVVILCLPSGAYGTNSAATVVAHMQSTFPAVRYGLMVGIGGGVPSKEADIRLGDVVVSKPTGTYGGVVQYDLRKATSGGQSQLTGTLNQPPTVLLTAISQIQSSEMQGHRSSISGLVAEALDRNPGMQTQFSCPGQKNDRLFNASYVHPEADSNTCVGCGAAEETPREPRASDEPQIHYGLVASGNQVIKDAKTRDEIAQQLHVLCFEMEAAGVMNQLPCLVIRGICDYCDSHKNKQWQGYAALTAAAYAKRLLSAVPVYAHGAGNSQKGHWMVPFERNPRFVGRHDEVLRLEERIFQKGKARKMAIAGLGGMGKTQIALELAYRVHEKDPPLSIFWIPSTSPESIEQAFIGISKKLQLQNVPPQDVKSRVQECLSSEMMGPWLLIIDNADDMNMWIASNDSTPALKTYLPRCEQGFILFTTRNLQLATKLVGPEVITLDEMDDGIAADLLRESLIKKDLLNNYQHTTQLLHMLSNLPLAIIQAAAYINETGISLSAYLEFLQGQDDSFIQLLSKDFEDEWRYTEIQNAVAVTWLISFHQIQNLNPVAADYLSFMACIDPRDIPQSLLPPSDSNIHQQEALGLLKAYSFIAVQTDSQFLSLHRLVHLATRNWLKSQYVLEEWTQKTGLQLNEVFPSDEPENRVLWRGYLPHAQCLLARKEFQELSDERERLLNKVGICLLADGRYNEAILALEEIFRNDMKNLGSEHLDTLTSMYNLATVYSEYGRWKDAQELLIQVLEIRKRVLGSEHPGTLACMSKLAMTYSDQGRWEDAEKLQVATLSIRKRVLGPEHPDTLLSMNNLAVTYSNQGRWEDTEELRVLTLEVQKRVLGPEHPDTLTSMDNLAMTYNAQGRWEEAEKLRVSALEITKQVLGPEHPNTLIGMNNLAMTYSAQGRWEDAEKLRVSTLEIMKRVLGPEHPDTLTSMGNLAMTYSDQGRWEEAEELQVSTLEITKRVLGPEHPDTLTCMNNLAMTYSDQGRWEEAEELQVSTLGIRKRVLGPEHPRTLTSMKTLAHTRFSRGRKVSAAILMNECIKLRTKILGLNHPDTKDSLEVFAEWQEDK